MEDKQQLDINTNLDWNKIITDVIMKHEEAFVKALTTSVGKKYKKARVSFGSAFRVYLENALEKYSKVKTLLYRNEPRSLYEFYEYNDISNSLDKHIDCEHVGTVLDDARFSVILGDGGSGKTMLMRHFFINALQESSVIPIFVELRNMDKDISIFDYLYKCLHLLGFDLESEFFRYALNQGMFLFLLDGFDEIKANVKETFYLRLEEFCDMYCKNFFIVS